MCSPPGGTGDLPGIHSCSSEAQDVIGAVIEMPHFRTRDVDILLGQPWTQETLHQLLDHKAPKRTAPITAITTNAHGAKKMAGPCGLKTSLLVLKLMCFLSSQLLSAQKPGKDALSCLLLGSIQTACAGGSPPRKFINWTGWYSD